MIVVGVRFVAAPGAELPGLGGDLLSAGWYGILQSGGLLFFAFAGYARIATMGEEVKNPAVAIPRAITISLSIVLAVYLVLGVLSLAVLGPDGLAQSGAPLVAVAVASGAAWLTPFVQILAALAARGALLALIAGVGRTTLAMARNGDLPRGLAAFHPRSQVPHWAEVILAVTVCVLIVVVDLRQAIGFSSFGVLLYYSISNVAAFTQDRTHRRYPRVVPVIGAIGCVGLAATLPWQSVLGGVAVLALGLLVRLVRLRWDRTPSTR